MMKFAKQVLQDLVDNEEVEGVEVIETEMVDRSRWSIQYEMIFTHEGKFYSSHYGVGATEDQDESPYEYDDDEIECTEVWPHEKVVVSYGTKPDHPVTIELCCDRCDMAEAMGEL